VKLGSKGIEKVYELPLEPDEKAAFQNSVDAVAELVKVIHAA